MKMKSGFGKILEVGKHSIDKNKNHKEIEMKIENNLFILIPNIYYIWKWESKTAFR